jgi:hypothetical protein
MIWKRTLQLAAVALGSVAASILLPSLVITAHAWMTREGVEIARFAARVAEPLALLGAAGVALAAARRRPRSWSTAGSWSLAVGIVSAGAIVAAAYRVGDVDLWTAAAAAVLPAVALLGGRRAGAESRPAPSAAPPTLSVPEPGTPLPPPPGEGPTADARAGGAVREPAR